MIGSNMLVSVIIPFYNRIPATVDAIKSVQRQNYDLVEMVLVDDGSTDDTAIIDKISKQNENIKLIKLIENKGPSYARNVGIKIAVGEYVAFLDSDDIWLPEKLSIQVGYMQKNKYLFTHTSYTRVFRKDSTSTSAVVDSGKHVYRYPFAAFSCRIATPTVVLKRALLKNNAFNDDMRFMEDTLLWLNLSSVIPLYGLDKVLTKVNVSSESSAFQFNKYLVGMKNVRDNGINHTGIAIIHYFYTYLRYFINKIFKI